ncbi:hypothetical protein [Chitinimonas arctica]|uniref:hypothetical protein n=1 Tax=Chitinimonas arctica TaxID=2594795 RepID=UPI0015D2B2ED|nr:hypothetical protein [Chitinimonas arctica]
MRRKQSEKYHQISAVRAVPLRLPVMGLFQHLRHIDDFHALQLAKPIVEPRFVRGTDNGKDAGAGAFAERFPDIGDHAVKLSSVRRSASGKASQHSEPNMVPLSGQVQALLREVAKVTFVN